MAALKVPVTSFQIPESKPKPLRAIRFASQGMTHAERSPFIALAQQVVTLPGRQAVTVIITSPLMLSGNLGAGHRPITSGSDNAG